MEFVAQLVERLFVAQVAAGSKPVKLPIASLAQLAEQLTFNEQVVGSSPTCGTNLLQ